MMKPIRVAVLCSGSASSFRFLSENDPNYGSLYQVVGVFSDVPQASGIEYADAHSIPTKTLDFAAWLLENGMKRTDLKRREPYFEKVLKIISVWEPEALMLSGFMLLLTEPLLSAFSGRILNVHPALLSIRTADGKDRKYRGLNVVQRAMDARDPTGSTVHIVVPEADMGPIVTEVTLVYHSGDSAKEHQERMKTACDGPAFQAAFERLIKSGWPAVPWQATI